ncbi:ABC transporter ATP-binding protein [Sulfobacillus thermosulfidooxidans]|uniref:ABC transporter ATP-binding protein n=1 Tax=Sulfobacillus thermosulfidooxidans TaxID=28034 RepID=UPI00041605B1|nr:ABC transporter ATP-binding protein [Sulfobacillus thermosulfidooxidans]
MTPVVVLEHVQKTFGSHLAVSDLSLTIDRGESIAILGPNGAGKTTTIGMMLGLQKPSSGRVWLLGGNPSDPKRHIDIGVVLQNVSVPDRLTVKECLNLFRQFYPHPRPLEDLLAMAGLEDDARKMAQSLSGGKVRRLQFALAMTGNPDVLFLDEPTVGMDVGSKRKFWDALQTYVKEGKTLILTTHDLQEADAMTNRVLVMNHGAVIADGTPEAIKKEFAGRQVSFVPGNGIDLTPITQWPEVVDVHVAGRRTVVVTKDSDTTLRRLIEGHWDIRDIMVGGGGLEEAFVRLTQLKGDSI